MVEKSDVDFGKTAQDYAQHRAGFPPSFFEELFRSKWLQNAKHALDLGTGTGTVARGLASRGLSVVGTGLIKTGLWTKSEGFSK